MGTNKSGEKGQTIILVALLITVLLLFVGIAIDSGIGYGVKAKLSSAVDAAALAAGKALGQPGTDAGRIANATLTAQKFFAANFPDGYLRATPTMQDPVIVHDQTAGKWNISVTASATVPTFFLRLSDQTTFTAQSEAAATRRDLDMAFVIDVTSSLVSPVDYRAAVKADAKSFVNNFIESSDRIALIHYALGAVVDEPINTTGRGFNSGSVQGDIDNFSFGGRTNFSEAFWRARDQLNSIPVANRSSLRVIVFFTDGDPNSFSSTFTDSSGGTHPGVISTDSTGPTSTYLSSGRESGGPYGLNAIGQIVSSVSYNVSNIKTLPSYFNVGGATATSTEFGVTVNTLGSTWRPVSSTTNYTNVNFASRNLAEDMAKRARSEGIFVYTLGLGTNLTLLKGPSPGETGEHLLKRMANDPRADTYDPSQPVGLYCFAADPVELGRCFDKVASKILRLTK